MNKSIELLKKLIIYADYCREIEVILSEAIDKLDHIGKMSQQEQELQSINNENHFKIKEYVSELKKHNHQWGLK